MSIHRIALANLRFPSSPEESLRLAIQAIERAAAHRAEFVCFPENYIPGYRAEGKNVPQPDPGFLDRAALEISAHCKRTRVAAVVGAERIAEGRLYATAWVFDREGKQLGFQDKVQLDPSEDGLYAAGAGRKLFEVNGLKFGIAICHEGWRYPETVRWAAQRGAHIVFHPHFHEASEGSYRPKSFADPQNTFHEKAALCRAAENICYFATVNYASAGSPTTSAFVAPGGELISFQPYGEEGVLVAEIDTALATGLLAKRCKAASY